VSLNKLTNEYKFVILFRPVSKMVASMVRTRANVTLSEVRSHIEVGKVSVILL
jgi:ribosomal protein L18E